MLPNSSTSFVTASAERPNPSGLTPFGQGLADHADACGTNGCGVPAIARLPRRQLPSTYSMSTAVAPVRERLHLAKIKSL